MTRGQCQLAVTDAEPSSSDSLPIPIIIAIVCAVVYVVVALTAILLDVRRRRRATNDAAATTALLAGTSSGLSMTTAALSAVLLSSALRGELWSSFQGDVAPPLFDDAMPVIEFYVPLKLNNEPVRVGLAVLGGSDIRVDSDLFARVFFDVAQNCSAPQPNRLACAGKCVRWPGARDLGSCACDSEQLRFINAGDVPTHCPLIINVGETMATSATVLPTTQHFTTTVSPTLRPTQPTTTPSIETTTSLPQTSIVEGSSSESTSLSNVLPTTLPAGQTTKPPTTALTVVSEDQVATLTMTGNVEVDFGTRPGVIVVADPGEHRLRRLVRAFCVRRDEPRFCDAPIFV